jgi:alcohol dehydrogenase class IV
VATAGPKGVDMTGLRKFVAPEFVFGAGALELAGRYARNLGANRILVVTDPGVRAAGWTDAVLRAVDAEGLDYVVFDAVRPNPRSEEVMAGSEVYRRRDCDVILAVGGGSPMDAAKAIGIVCSNHRHVLEFEGVDRVDHPGPPLICVPTTAGTAADISQFAMLTNSHERHKVAIISKTVVPDVALIDPCTTLSMPPELTAGTGMDVLAHAFEAFVSTAGSPVTDLHAREAVRLVCRHLPDVLEAPQDLERRGHMMLASLEAGLAFSNASLGMVHAMSHSLGGELDLPHGECNALLLEHVVAFNFEAARDRYREIAHLMGLEVERQPDDRVREALCEALARLREAVGIRAGLARRGVRAEDLARLARRAVIDPCMATNPRLPDWRQVEAVYEKAF